MDHLPFLLQLGFVCSVFFVTAYAAFKVRLPAVLAFIALGVAAAGWIRSTGGGVTLHRLAEIGIVFLFFLVGLEFPLGRMRDVGRRVWAGGLLDMVLNLGVLMTLAILAGCAPMTAFVIGAVGYATSSSITVKLLDEQKRLANPEAEFILALLIFEDLVAPVLVSFLAASRDLAALTPWVALLLGAKILGLVGGALVLGPFVFRRLGSFVGRNLEQDFIALLTAALALGYAGLALALGLSEILGAFLAGVMLAETGRTQDLEHLLLPVRDLTLPFFFFWFGTTVSLTEGVPMIGLLLVALTWALIGKVLTGYIGGRWFGLRPKAALRAGFCLLGRGEFSAVIAATAAPPLRVFAGMYVVASAVVGVFFFQHAPALAARIQSWSSRLGAGEAPPPT